MEKQQVELYEAVLQVIETEKTMAEGSNWFVITFKNLEYGASRLYHAIFNFQEQFGEQQFYVLPASVHEFLVCPIGVFPKEELTPMVKDINENHLSPTERLGNNAYFYDGCKFVKID